jgi:hypothetical protein
MEMHMKRGLPPGLFVGLEQGQTVRVQSPLKEVYHESGALHQLSRVVRVNIEECPRVIARHYEGVSLGGRGLIEECDGVHIFVDDVGRLVSTHDATEGT